MTETKTTPPRATLDFDLVERAALCGLFALLAYRTISAAIATGDYLNIVLLISEAAMVVFILLRRRTDAFSLRPLDWIIGFAATAAPLLVQPGSGHAIAPTMLCALIMMTGFVFQLMAKFTLRRSFGIVAANRGVKAGGPYKIVRHPMYAGYAMTHVGFLLASPNLWNLALYSFVLGAQLYRINAEERILRQDPAYQAIMTAVPYRLVPFVY